MCAMNVIEQGFNVARTSIVMDAWSRQQRISVHGWIYAIDNGLLRDLGVSITRPEEAPQPIRRGGQESRRPAGCGKTFTVAVAYESSDRNFAVLHGNSQIPRGIFDFYTELLNSASLFEIPHRILHFRTGNEKFRVAFSNSRQNFEIPIGIWDFRLTTKKCVFDFPNSKAGPF